MRRWKRFQVIIRNGGALGESESYYDGPLRPGEGSFELERWGWLRTVPERYRNTVEDMTEEQFWENGGYDYIASLHCRGKGRDALRHGMAIAGPADTAGQHVIAAQVAHSRHRSGYISAKTGKSLRGKK